MSLTLKDLENVMGPLSQLGKGEMTFDVGNLSLTLRTLTPSEELEIQRYARAALAEGEVTDQTSALDFLDRFRYMTLAHSLVQVGPLDFRGVEHVLTGETLPNGVAVKIPKPMAVLKIVSNWSREMSVAVMRKFEKLSNQVEAELEKVIVFEESELDAEIARLEEKLADLKDQKAKADLNEVDPRSEMRARVAASSATQLAPPKKSPQPTDPGNQPKILPPPHVEEAVFVAPVSDLPKQVLVEDSTEVVPQPQQPPVASRRSVLGDRVPAQPIIPPEPKVEAKAQSQLPSDPLWDVQSSFEDASDPSVLEAAIRREQERVARPQAHAPIGPHLSARDAYEEVQKTFEKDGSIDGVDVYRAPAQEVTPRTSQRPIRPPAQGTINPKFRPPAQ